MTNTLISALQGQRKVVQSAELANKVQNDAVIVSLFRLFPPPPPRKSWTYNLHKTCRYWRKCVPTASWWERNLHLIVYCPQLKGFKRVPVELCLVFLPTSQDHRDETETGVHRDETETRVYRDETRVYRDETKTRVYGDKRRPGCIETRPRSVETRPRPGSIETRPKRDRNWGLYRNETKTGVYRDETETESIETRPRPGSVETRPRLWGVETKSRVQFSCHPPWQTNHWRSSNWSERSTLPWNTDHYSSFSSCIVTCSVCSGRISVPWWTSKISSPFCL